MARLRVNSECNVHCSVEQVAEIHDVPEASVLDWGNGYAILNVEFISEPDPEPEEVEEYEAVEVIEDEDDEDE